MTMQELRTELKKVGVIEERNGTQFIFLKGSVCCTLRQYKGELYMLEPFVNKYSWVRQTDTELIRLIEEFKAES